MCLKNITQFSPVMLWLPAAFDMNYLVRPYVYI